ncbi:uncharacterized protein JN550_009241 [Neoarthrinium moseri]|uniref:uncharacterized protein n=1 Tax=Neoarthrinium moseri TaxID=1658444 RepID=UPI001FDD8536|nr:uncharacterized protein JN550_009241 [Neoarthrinium moseri]KAI1863962.1 hypothetical protein JN550_009241 [Neoarthrinium moseri]
MDVAYKQHASPARRKNRSSTNLNHLTLAPLTSKLPLADPDDLPEFVASPLQHNVSYLQGKSAPTTPRLLARSPARGNSRSRQPSAHEPRTDTLPKSKSASHLAGISNGQHKGAGSFTPTSRRRKEDHSSFSIDDRNDSDWMLRAGALISTEAREFKGQAWLVSKQSSTSLTGLRDAEEEAFERELAREKELASRRGSRRGSLAAEDMMTAPSSRLGSRHHSRRGSRTLPRTPLDRQTDEGYFNQVVVSEEYIQGPDFVGLDEKLEAIEIDTSQADEATVRRLVKRESVGKGSWMGNLIGWSLFSVEENEEESDSEDSVSDSEESGHLERSASTRHLEGISSVPEPRIPPPKSDDGGWQDAAWLLSVASKVMF